MRSWAKRVRKTALGLGLALLLGFALLLVWPMDTGPYLATTDSPRLHDRNGALLHVDLNADEAWLLPVALEGINPHLLRATLSAEDKRFHGHPGVDPLALLRACLSCVWHREARSGASTITMQLVKRQIDSRSLRGKLVQMAEALRLERRASKDAILAAYLNTVPYGLNVSGCEAATWRYFGKPAAALSLAEAALLAALPKAPSRLMPLAHPERAKTRRDWVLRRMHETGHIGPAELETALAASIGTAWHAFPRHAGHLASHKTEGVHQATVDRELQRHVQAALAKRLDKLRGEVDNGAVLVVDVDSAEVLAYAGSGSFFDARLGGQYDAAQAPRSPGSALKPFLYALAMERQLLYPCEVLLDAPWDSGCYSPENYYPRFRGPVDAGEALRASLNIPAVTVINRLGVAPFSERLQACGMTTLHRRPEDYGLGLTLGNCEVRLFEMAQAYTMLANLGQWRPLRCWANNPPASVPARQVYDQAVCVKLFDMLEQQPPGELEKHIASPINARTPVCWKTGTSPGNRDAWTFMFNRHYVVGVWLGNSDGSPSYRLIGAAAALPVATRVFRDLPEKNTPAWPEREALRLVEVCARSGLPPSTWCPHRNTAALPESQHLHRQCDLHYPTRRAAAGPLGEDGEIVERWPAAPITWNLAHVEAPRKAADVAQRAQALRIVSPADGAQYILTHAFEGDLLRLKAENGHGALAWYGDGKYLGSRPRLRYALAPGTHQVSCMATDGRSHSVSFSVASPKTGP